MVTRNDTLYYGICRISPTSVQLSFREPIVPPKMRGEVNTNASAFSSYNLVADMGKEDEAHYAVCIALAGKLAKNHHRLCLISYERTSPYDLVLHHGLAALDVERQLRELFHASANDLRYTQGVDLTP